MSRLNDTFARLRSSSQTGLVTYVTAGDPDEERFTQVLRALDRAGSDVLEIGIPFSDPLADGPAIQRASERALMAGTTLNSSLALLRDVSSSLSAAVVIFTYVNPILAMGIERFMSRAKEAGVDGVLILDLPIEEAQELRDKAVSAGIDPIFLLSPTTVDARIKKASELGRGFLYAISRLGVTGERDTIAKGARELGERIRRITTMPVAMGFGISNPQHVTQIGQWADAAVVGSGLVNTIARVANSDDLAGEVERYVHWLRVGTARD